MAHNRHHCDVEEADMAIEFLAPLGVSREARWIDSRGLARSQAPCRSSCVGASSLILRPGKVFGLEREQLHAAQVRPHGNFIKVDFRTMNVAEVSLDPRRGLTQRWPGQGKVREKWSSVAGYHLGSVSRAGDGVYTIFQKRSLDIEG